MQVKLNISIVFMLMVMCTTVACQNRNSEKQITTNLSSVPMNDDWKSKLTPEQYYVLREKGTERAFTGKYWNHKENGVYACAGCGEELFTSTTKFDSGCGWPSFYDVMEQGKIKTEKDYSFGMVRIEVMCGKCGGHLGHVFDDGPRPTGLRYCINSVSIDFKKEGEEKK
jgi:peptide-methionine (R)-S-oxide reductase